MTKLKKYIDKIKSYWASNDEQIPAMEDVPIVATDPAPIVNIIPAAPTPGTTLGDMGLIIATNLPDNTSELITPAMLRDVFEHFLFATQTAVTAAGGKVPIGATAPSAPAEGDLWIDSSLSGYILKAYKNAAWRQVGLEFLVGTGAQLPPVDSVARGTIFEDTDDESVFMKMAGAWTRIDGERESSLYTLGASEISTGIPKAYDRVVISGAVYVSDIDSKILMIAKKGNDWINWGAGFDPNTAIIRENTDNNSWADWIPSGWSYSGAVLSSYMWRRNKWVTVHIEINIYEGAHTEMRWTMLGQDSNNHRRMVQGWVLRDEVDAPLTHVGLKTEGANLSKIICRVHSR
jgi:hypothetical protein